MKVVIIEDERLASQKLSRLIEEIDPGIEILKILKSVEGTTNWLLNNSHPDLIFMDIQLEDGTCFEIFENCEIKTPVIFTTAYDAYTLKAFKVNSVDYLLKPVLKEDLERAINKFKEVHTYRLDPAKLEFLLNQLQTKTKERFLIKIGEHYRSVQTRYIHCFFIRERCNFIQVDNGKSYALDHSLDRIEGMVDSKMFFRINRNFIINYSAIQDVVAYSSSRLKVILKNRNDAENILVSRERVSSFKRWMDR